MHISSPCRLLAQPGHIGTHRPIRSISLLQHPRDHHTDDHCTSLRLGCVSKCLKDGDDLGRSILNYLLPSMYTFDHCGIFLKHLVAISSPLPQKSIDFFHLRTRPFPPAMANPTSARDDDGHQARVSAERHIFPHGPSLSLHAARNEWRFRGATKSGVSHGLTIKNSRNEHGVLAAFMDQQSTIEGSLCT